MLTNITWASSTPVAPFTAAALRGEVLALAAAELVHLVHRGVPATTRIARTLQLSFVVDRVALSPSGRFLLAGDALRIEVWDLQDHRRVLELWATQPRRFGIAGTFARHAGRELVIWTDEGARLQGCDLDAQAPVFSCLASTFRFAATPFMQGGQLIAPGFFQGETKESLAGTALAQLVDAPESITADFQHKRAVLDHAYRLCAGAAGDAAVVVFRDPEGDETEPLNDDDPPAVYDDVWGFRGLYIRRVDGTLVERVPWDGPIQSHAAIVASPTRIAAACLDGIHVVTRAGSDDGPPIAARWLAAAPDGSEVLVQTADGALAFL